MGNPINNNYILLQSSNCVLIFMDLLFFDQLFSKFNDNEGHIYKFSPTFSHLAKLLINMNIRLAWSGVNIHFSLRSEKQQRNTVIEPIIRFKTPINHTTVPI